MLRTSLHSVRHDAVPREAVLDAARDWARRLRAAHPEVIGIGCFGSYARGDYTPGSDLDVLIEVARLADSQLLRDEQPTPLRTLFPEEPRAPLCENVPNRSEAELREICGTEPQNASAPEAAAQASGAELGYGTIAAAARSARAAPVPLRRRADRAALYAPDSFPIAMDLFIYTTDELAQLRAQGWAFLQTIEKEMVRL